MPALTPSSKSVRLLLTVLLGGSLLIGCSDDGGGDEASASSAHADSIEAFTGLLPADVRGAMAVDIDALTSDGSTDELDALLAGDGAAPALGDLLDTFGGLTGAVDVPGQVTSALLAQTTDAAEGSFLLAQVRGETLDEVVDGAELTSGGNVGPASRAQSVDRAGNHLVLLPDGVLVVGTEAAVASVVAVADGEDTDDESPIAPFLDVLEPGADVSFAYGLPALFDDEIAPDRTLAGAAVMSGSFDVADGDIGGSLAFHTANASEFVDDYNALNRNATGGKDPTEKPLRLADPVAEDLEQVVVTLPTVPLDASADDLVAPRNIAKKLLVGMEAHDYAEGLGEDGNPALLDLVVKSAEDGDTPPSPGSVFIRWGFRDQAAIEAFEAEVLPDGFTLAPTRFLETDDPEGEYFLTLNLYNSGGGSIVSGARAEWDVFVKPPPGADPDGGTRPRFMIVDALAQAASADPLHLVTPAEPLSHAFEGDEVVSTVARSEDGKEVPVFSSSFATPDPEQAEVARFTREMAISNDYIYWPNGVYDRAVYNATTFNHDAYLVDPDTITVDDSSRWAQYLDPAVKDAVYYVNTLEYVASPMANLDSEFLDVTPEWRKELKTFKYNGHQTGLMRGAVDQLFRGKGDALVGFRVGNETPSASYNFEITDPDALEATLDLPEGHRLAPISLVDGSDEGRYLTLSVTEVEGATEGTRAEWSVTVEDDHGRPYRRVLDVMTADVGIDAESIVNLPSDVRHDLDDGVLTTRLSSQQITFDASFATAGATDRALSLDWIESGDNVCAANDICDAYYYDAETLDVAVHQPAKVKVEELSTPWDEFIDPTPTLVYERDNPQDFAAKRWYNLDVPVEELPVDSLADATHTISGSGTLVGRATDVVDSDYTYTGDAVVDDDQLTFSIDQAIDNTLGVAHIYTTGRFDLTSGTGTQKVVDCRGPELMCSDIELGSTAPYTAQELDASDPDAIAWQVDLAIDLGGSFGTADSASTFLATRED